MDKKLLLTIQSVCNADGVKIPWDKVGRIMGEQISDGAVIQHLAKVRQRMVRQGLSVPPPLRRGGGTMISTGYSAGSARVAATNPSGGLSYPAQGKNEENEEEFDADKATDMDEEYGQPSAKRTKRGKKAGTAEKASGEAKGQVDIKVEESDGNEGSSADQKETQKVNSKKRKREVKKTSLGKGKGKGLPKGKGSSPNNHPRRSSVNYTELSGGYHSQNDDDSGDGEEYVGKAAPYMKFAESPVLDEDKEKVKEQHLKPYESATPSKVVVLQVGSAHLLKEAKRLEGQTAIKSGHDSESDEQSEEVETDDEGVETRDEYVETGDEHVATMGQLVNRQPNLDPNGVFGVFGPVYGNQVPTAYHQYNNTAPVSAGFTPAANGQLTPYSSSAVNNGNWYQAPEYTYSSFTANATPSSFMQPPALSTTRVTIPQQTNGPNVEGFPTSATTTYSGNTPVLMADQYYAALDDDMTGMNDMEDPFSQAYHDPTAEDSMFGRPSGGFDYFDY